MKCLWFKRSETATQSNGLLTFFVVIRCVDESAVDDGEHSDQYQCATHYIQFEFHYFVALAISVNNRKKIHSFCNRLKDALKPMEYLHLPIDNVFTLKLPKIVYLSEIVSKMTSTSILTMTITNTTRWAYVSILVDGFYSTDDVFIWICFFWNWLWRQTFVV